MNAPFERKPKGSGDRLLAALALFTIERPQWTVEEAAERLGVSATTAYRYFKQLTGTRPDQPGRRRRLHARPRHRPDGPAAPGHRPDADRRARGDGRPDPARAGRLDRPALPPVPRPRDVHAPGDGARPAGAGELRARPPDAALPRRHRQDHPGAPADAHAQVLVRARRRRDHRRRPRQERRRFPQRARDAAARRRLRHPRRDRSPAASASARRSSTATTRCSGA